MYNVKSARSWLAAAAVVLLLTTLLASPIKAAADGSGGGCNVIINPSCTVDVHGGGHGGGTGRGGGNSVHGSGHGGGRIDGCTNMNPTTGCDPCTPETNRAACQAYTQNIACSEQNPSGFDAATWLAFMKSIGCADNTYAPVSPAVLAQDALATIHFPRPSGSRSPSQANLYNGTPMTWVQLWTYFWTSSSTWHSLSAPASAGGVSATVRAVPVSLTFDPGDGSSVVQCSGHGRPWTSADGNTAPSAGACGFRYLQVTKSPITTTQTITWQITWTGTGNSSGTIPSLSTSTSGKLQVLQIQVVTR